MSQFDITIVQLVVHGLAVVLNAITMVVIIASKRLRKTQNVFTFNIALVDCVTSSLVFSTLLQSLIQGKSNEAVYLVMRSSLLTGICSTLAVAIHRFIIIRFDPFNKLNLVTGPRCIAVSAIIWIIPAGTFFTIKSFNKDASVDTLIMPTVTFTSHVLCALCYTVVYWTIAGAARKAGLTDRMLVQRVKQNKKVLTTFALVVGTNLVCLSPLSLTFFISYIRPDLVLNPATFRLATGFKIWVNLSRGLLGLNGILNPIVYWTRLTDFRSLLTKQCSRCAGRKATLDASISKPDSTENRDQHTIDDCLQTQESAIIEPPEGARSGKHDIYTVPT